MTTFAIRSKRVLMFILMTIHARLRKPEIRLLSGFVYDVENIGILDILFCMTLGAINRSMFPRSHKTCLGMVE